MPLSTVYPSSVSPCLLPFYSIESDLRQIARSLKNPNVSSESLPSFEALKDLVPLLSGFLLCDIARAAVGEDLGDDGTAILAQFQRVHFEKPILMWLRNVLRAFLEVHYRQKEVKLELSNSYRSDPSEEYLMGYLADGLSVISGGELQNVRKAFMRKKKDDNDEVN